MNDFEHWLEGPGVPWRHCISDGTKQIWVTTSCFVHGKPVKYLKAEKVQFLEALILQHQPKVSWNPSKSSVYTYTRLAKLMLMLTQNTTHWSKNRKRGLLHRQQGSYSNLWLRDQKQIPCFNKVFRNYRMNTQKIKLYSIACHNL